MNTIKACFICFWQCSGNSAPSPAHFTASLYLWCSEGNKWGEVESLLKGAVSAQKDLQGRPRQVARRNEIVMRDSNSREDKSGIFFQKANRNKTGLMGAPGICTATVGGTKHLLTGQGGFYSREKGMSEAYNVICLFSIVRPKDSHDASKRCLVKKWLRRFPSNWYCKDMQSIVALARYQF